MVSDSGPEGVRARPGEVAGDRVGQGSYTWADGKVYTGPWANNLRNGVGVMTFSNGNRRAHPDSGRSAAAPPRSVPCVLFTCILTMA